MFNTEPAGASARIGDATVPLTEYNKVIRQNQRLRAALETILSIQEHQGGGLIIRHIARNALTKKRNSE